MCTVTHPMWRALATPNKREGRANAVISPRRPKIPLQLHCASYASATYFSIIRYLTCTVESNTTLQTSASSLVDEKFAPERFFFFLAYFVGSCSFQSFSSDLPGFACPTLSDLTPLADAHPWIVSISTWNYSTRTFCKGRFVEKAWAALSWPACFGKREKSGRKKTS